MELEEIIDAPEGREIKRALAVKMVRLDFKTKDICDLLEVSDAFVSKWKTIYEEKGAGALRLGYRGSAGFLSESQRRKLCFYLKDKPHVSLEGLRDIIKAWYGVVYQSKQSYYDVLREAGFSWHRSQATNPKRDAEQVWHRRAELKKTGE